jgi:hypothetical protein
MRGQVFPGTVVDMCDGSFGPNSLDVALFLEWIRFATDSEIGSWSSGTGRFNSGWNLVSKSVRGVAGRALY